MSNKVRIPPLDAIVDAHAHEMRRSGQEPRVRDQSMLESAYSRPLNRAHYDVNATIFDLAAELAFGFSQNHGFVDGNKRAAFASVNMVLGMNGLTPDWTIREAIELFNQLADGKINTEELANWLKTNCMGS